MGCMLAACTAYEPPATYLPPRSGVIPGETITVGNNQNIYAIAQEHGVSMRDIMVLNNLQQPFALKPGQTLVLPFKRGDVAAAPATPPLEPLNPAPIGGVQEAPLAAIQTQPLPPPVMVAPAVPSPAKSPVEALNAPVAPLKSAATTVAQPQLSAKPAPVATASDTPPPSMIWPVQGPVLSGFGPKGQGVNNDGVNIGAPKGAPVVAAAGGTVAYAGDDMKGFGNLVLIRHEGDWVTAYAYLDRVLVAKDAVVAQGDMIGTVGKSGNISSPQLHFETRHGGKVVDPAGVIK